ncbi:MAG: DUF6377 domain-containing protein [Bacteroidales bacterium]|nr:DUF6377 domain-containing protein [Bacteroidales bacterium]
MFRILYHTKYIICLFFIIFSFYETKAENIQNELTRYLDKIIENKEEFTEQKDNKINDLKRLKNISDISLQQKYEINMKIYSEYKSYILDSAIFFLKENLEIAKNLDNKYLYTQTSLSLAEIYSFFGWFLECEEIINSTDRSVFDNKLLSQYYKVCLRVYMNYNALHFNSKYANLQTIYRDSLISVLDTTSYDYKLNYAFKNLNSQNVEKSKKILIELMETVEPDSPSYAMITYALSAVYNITNDKELKKKYLTLSAIADLKNAIKENASFQALAFICYEEGDIERAFNYTQSAIEDAVFGDIQVRAATQSKFYSIINTAYKEKEEKAKMKIFICFIIAGILSVTLIILLLFISRQIKKVSIIKEELFQANEKLSLLNNQLSLNNSKLLESNYVKEQYIAQFFDLCSDYINKMEEFRKSLYKTAMNRQIDELIKRLRSTASFEYEIEELYRHFDTIFLNIYPTFVEDLNSLLEKEEQIHPKSDGLLTKELRIYALLRLGISDSSKIASFLRCSMSTVYNYRTKMRNKSLVAREDFEKHVMMIGENNDYNKQINL